MIRGLNANVGVSTKMDRERMMTEAWSVTQEILSLAELNSKTKQNRDGVEMVQRT